MHTQYIIENQIPSIWIIVHLFKENYNEILDQTNGSIKCYIQLFVGKHLNYTIFKCNFKKCNIHNNILSLSMPQLQFKQNILCQTMSVLFFLICEESHIAIIYQIK